jgi:hypothetical protein
LAAWLADNLVDLTAFVSVDLTAAVLADLKVAGSAGRWAGWLVRRKVALLADMSVVL